MEVILAQLSALVVLTGISIAVAQYLFTNHQSSLKDFLDSLEELDFNQENTYDKGLETLWEQEVSKCKEHTYRANPIVLILLGFVLVLFEVTVYFLIQFYQLQAVFEFFIINIPKEVLPQVSSVVLFLLSFCLLAWMFFAVKVLDQVLKKEVTIKSTFEEIRNKHNIVAQTLNKDE